MCTFGFSGCRRVKTWRPTTVRELQTCSFPEPQFQEIKSKEKKSDTHTTTPHTHTTHTTHTPHTPHEQHEHNTNPRNTNIPVGFPHHFREGSSQLPSGFPLLTCPNAENNLSLHEILFFTLRKVKSQFLKKKTWHP